MKTSENKNQKIEDSQPKNNLSFVKRLAVSYSLLLLITLLVGFGLYSYSADKVTDGIKKQNLLSLSSGADQVSQALSTIQAAASQLSGNNAFVDFATHAQLADQDFFLRAAEVQRTLVPLLPLEKTLPIRRSYIYLKNTRYVISHALFTEQTLYYKGIRSFYDNGYTTWLTYINDDRNWYHMIPIANFYPDSRDYLYTVPLSNASNYSLKKIPAVLCYEFDYDALMRLFSNVSLYDSGYIAAVSPDGSVNFVLHPEDSSAPSVDTQLLAEQHYTNGCASFQDPETGRSMLATKAASSTSNLCFYLVQPEKEAFFSLNTYQNIFSIILMVAVLVGVVILYLLSLFNARPVMELSYELDTEKAMTADLSELVQKHTPIVAESFVRRIMEGSVSMEGEMRYITEVLGLTRPNRKYCVLYIEAFPASSTIIHSGNMDLCIQNYDVLVRDAIARYFPDTGYVHKPNDRNFAVLLSHSKELDIAAVSAEVHRRFTQMHDELLDRYGIWVNAGMGNRNAQLSFTWKSYQQAKDANSAATTEHYIRDYYSLHISKDSYYYPESFAVQLSGFISTGNTEQINELFHLLAVENTQNRQLSVSQMRWLINDIRVTLFKKRCQLADAAELSEDTQHQLDLIDRNFEENLNLTSLKNIALSLAALFGANAPETSGNEMITRIQEYISLNYHDSSLCLTRISDEFGISENYFSFLFKKTSGENFSVYLEKLRMTKARELVCNSEQPLSEIYELVGYNNAASFRRAFKKTFGFSPKEMRDKNYA